MNEILDAKSLVKAVRDLVEDAPQGYPFVAAFMDNRNHILLKGVFPGDLSCIPTSVADTAVAIRANGVALVIKTSSDIEQLIQSMVPVVYKFKKSLKNSGIRLIDVVLINGRQGYSFAEERSFRMLRRRKSA